MIVKAYSGNSDNFGTGAEVFITGSDYERILTVSSVQKVKSNFRVGLKEIEDRNTAEELIGKELCIPEGSLKELSENSFYVFDLIGCRILDDERKEYGEVREVINNPANDLLQVYWNNKDYLVPLVKEIVIDIDLEKRLIIIEPIEGLFD